MIYTYLKCQGENPLNNQYTLKNMKNRRVKQVLSWGWVPVRREGQKERAKE
jgi:hypothetical protein